MVRGEKVDAQPASREKGPREKDDDITSDATTPDSAILPRHVDAVKY
jgi:hypothetical protein